MAHSPHGINCDDLKHLLAVARNGSTLAAGRALGVDQSTVQRRLVELERRIGQALVQRQPTGYRLTEFGQEMLPFAEAVEQAVQGFERHLHTMARHRIAQWLHKVAPNVPMAARDAEPDLVQVIGPVAELSRIWRLLTTKELRRTPRVSAFFDFVVSEIETLRPIITG